MVTKRLSRRHFLKGVAAGAGATALSAASWSRVLGANERLQLASVGVGGKGWDDLKSVAASPHVGVVALCDVDESKKFLGQAAGEYPHAKTYTDWRRLLDQAQTVDAVTVSTPDHMHAPIAIRAMQLGKHVFCQKPLTHTVYEARQMRLAAAKHRLVTQMGNQIQSDTTYRTAVKLVHDGIIGKVKEVHAWQSGGMGWILAEDRPPTADPIPAYLHWDEWLGVAPARPYKAKLYHSFNWRAWQDFSNGQLGDFGCHILDPVFMALKLTVPTSIQAEAAPMNREIWSRWAKVHYQFPGTEFTVSSTLPLTWYDGEGRFPAPEAHGLPKNYKLPGSGSVLLGEKGTLVIPHVAMPKLFPEDKFADYKIEAVPSRNHYTSWADACRGVGATTSPFDYAGPLTETVLLGSIAIRLRGESLGWNAAEFKITGPAQAAALLTKSYRKGWEL